MKQKGLAILLAFIMSLCFVPQVHASDVTIPDTASGSLLTESWVHNRIAAINSSYPEGAYWGDYSSYSSSGRMTASDGSMYRAVGRGCAGFAYLASDAAFDGLDFTRKYSFSYNDIHVGDILRIKNDTHSVVVLEKYDDHIVVVEGNFNQDVHWGRTFSKSYVLGADYLLTRYPSFTKQPEAKSASIGDTVYFVVRATNNISRFQWLVSTDDGANWSVINPDVNANASTATLRVTVDSFYANALVRCRVWYPNNTFILSNTARISVADNSASESSDEDASETSEGSAQSPSLESSSSAPITITSQPSDVVAAIGSAGSFSVKATGNNLSYQWQYSSDGGKSWTNLSVSTGYNKDTVYFTVSSNYLGRPYRCVIKDSNGNTVITDSVKMSVPTPDPLKIVTQPSNVVASIGTNASFSVKASGTGLSYQWQYSTNGGSSWTNLSVSTGYNKDTVYFTVSSNYLDRPYRCVIKDSSGNVLTTNWVYMSLPNTSAPEPAPVSEPEQPAPSTPVSSDLVITSQPVDVNAPLGTSAYFSVKASGTGLAYQWQYSTNGGQTWTNLSVSTGYNKDTVYFTVSSNFIGRPYRCVIKDSKGNTVISDSVKMTVGDQTKPVITAQPTNVVAKLGTASSFSVKASGTGLTYQWQYSDNGGKTWTNLSVSTGYNKPTVYFTVSSNFIGRPYRCVIKDAYGNVLYTNSVYIKTP